MTMLGTEAANKEGIFEVPTKIYYPQDESEMTDVLYKKKEW